MVATVNLSLEKANKVRIVRSGIVLPLIDILKGGFERTRSQGSMRFKSLATAARAAEALREVEERGSEQARAMAKKIMLSIRGREEVVAGVTGEEEVDWEGGPKILRSFL